MTLAIGVAWACFGLWRQNVKGGKGMARVGQLPALEVAVWIGFAIVGSICWLVAGVHVALPVVTLIMLVALGLSAIGRRETQGLQISLILCALLTFVLIAVRGVWWLALSTSWFVAGLTVLIVVLFLASAQIRAWLRG